MTSSPNRSNAAPCSAIRMASVPTPTAAASSARTGPDVIGPYGGQYLGPARGRAAAGVCAVGRSWTWFTSRTTSSGRIG